MPHDDASAYRYVTINEFFNELVAFLYLYLPLFLGCAPCTPPQLKKTMKGKRLEEDEVIQATIPRLLSEI